MRQTALTIRKLVAAGSLVRISRQYGTLLVLCPTLWSLVLASGGKPPLRLLVIFILGTFLMRSAGCAINDIADRRFDGRVERTRSRPLPSGELTTAEAVFIFLSLSALAFILVLFLNRLTILLSFIGMALAVAYPFVKRVSHWPQAVLGMAFGWGAVMAWSAVNNSVGIVPLLIFGANILWSTAYDTIYALMDIEDDLRIGIKSTAILFGDKVYAALAALYWGVAVLLAVAGLFHGAGMIYYAGAVAALIAHLVVVYEVRLNPGTQGAWRGFLLNVWTGALMLAAIIMDAHL
ncbi:MAG: 4-hydroxybenzoate octaprenyltransferase [Deltaproteobacteria bacterium]|nr:4-hydroxybenzoate octaprenyltransferase [Deltaproteobacteria bacterium]